MPMGSGQSAIGINSPFAGGTPGRVIFVGTGPVLTEDSALSYNATTNALTASQVITTGGTASDPALTSSLETNTGIVFASGAMYIYISGVQRFGWGASSFALINDAAEIRLGLSTDVRLKRNAANDLYVDSHVSPTVATTNLQDLGKTGTNLWRRLFIGTNIQIEANNGLKLTNQTNGAAAQAGTLANAPVVGNPAFWCPITVNGTNRHFPCW